MTKTIEITSRDLIRALHYTLPHGKCTPCFLAVKMHWTYAYARGVSKYINDNYNFLLQKYGLN